MPRLNQKKLEGREKLIQLAIQHYNKLSKHSLYIFAETYSISCTTLSDRLNGAKIKLAEKLANLSSYCLTMV